MISDRKVRSVMQVDVHTVNVASPLSAAARLLSTHPFHHVPVVDGERLVGILSAHDVARVSLEQWVKDPATRAAWLDRQAVRDVMTPLPDVLHPDDPVRVAAERLGDGAYHALPVVDEHHQLVGIVTSTDLVRLLFSELR
ncbi:MAG: CBS domain-containing protein [Myxococcota bacterium]